MSRLPNVFIAFGFAFGLNAAIAQTVEPGAQKAPGENKVMKDDCTGMVGAAREQCLKAARTTDKISAGPCGKLTDRAARDCILDEFIRKHDHISGDRQVGSTQSLEPAGPQPR